MQTEHAKVDPAFIHILAADLLTPVLSYVNACLKLIVSRPNSLKCAQSLIYSCDAYVT